MADSSPHFSILLPTHNRADVLPYAIRSVLAQSLEDFELLIIGDGCTDDTDAVVQPFLRADSRVRWLPLAKAPFFGYANRNVALRQARGRLIGFMAHDDVVTADHFARLAAALEDPAAHLVHSGSAWVGTWGEIVPTLFHLTDSVMLAEFLAGRWNRVPATAFAYRQSAIDRVGLWSETLPRAADMDLWSRLIRAFGENSIRFSDEVTAFHFRAGWRTQDMTAPDNEPLWKHLHHTPGRLPPALRVPLVQGRPEQAAFWDWLQGDPSVLPAIRTALHRAAQTFAWEIEVRCGAGHPEFIESTSTAQGLPKLTHLRARADRLREELDRTKVRLAETRAALKEAADKKPRRFWKW